jgi:hypothetical protein
MYTKEDISEMVEEDGLEYIICAKINLKEIEDDTLRLKCYLAKEAIENALKELPEIDW